MKFLKLFIGGLPDELLEHAREGTAAELAERKKGKQADGKPLAFETRELYQKLKREGLL